jgi:23S rRNA (cytosine1962-C5)-methyltransferase
MNSASNTRLYHSNLLIADKWKDYELIDCSNGMRLERWGKYIISRPDPQIIWQHNTSTLWDKCCATFKRDSTGEGKWIFSQPLPPLWQISYYKMQLIVKLTPFKHTGIFPEQAVNWEWNKYLIQIGVQLKC